MRLHCWGQSRSPFDKPPTPFYSCPGCNVLSPCHSRHRNCVDPCAELLHMPVMLENIVAAFSAHHPQGISHARCLCLPVHLPLTAHRPYVLLHSSFLPLEQQVTRCLRYRVRRVNSQDWLEALYVPWCQEDMPGRKPA